MLRFIFGTLLLLSCSAHAQNKQVFGWVEKVRLFPADIVLHAKIDSGADYSSLSASKIKKFERNGSNWVSFQLKNRYGHKATVEKKIVRTARIKSHAGAALGRFVIRLGLCLGNTYMEEEVNLANRGNFDYQMLIGRSFLSGNVLIDPSLQYTVEPICNSDDEDENEDNESVTIPPEFETAEPKIDLTKKPNATEESKN